MGVTKRKITGILLLLLLGVFPFGQLPGMFLQDLLHLPFRPHPVDVISLFIVIFTISEKNVSPVFRKYKYVFAVIMFPSFLSYFTPYFDPYGLFYLFRILVYVVFFLYCTERGIFVRQSLVLKSLLIAGIGIAVFGWIQYLLFPDLVALKYFGWDDHYYRMTSTFMDPAFTGIILALSTFLSIDFYLRSKNYLIPTIFLILTLGFTYSRASFLALFVGLFVLLFKKHKKLLLLFAFLVVALVVFLPRTSGGEGVKLMRTSSITQKFANYQDSLKIISHSPLFGVGYNNLCKAKELLFIDTTKQKNSCYGLDNSFLFVWSTAGTLGVIAFLWLARNVYKHSINSKLVIASFSAVLVHSLFTNTLFYSWVIIWLSFLLLASSRGKIKL